MEGENDGNVKDNTLQFLSDVFLFDNNPNHVVLAQLMRNHLVLTTYGGNELESVPFSSIVGADVVQDVGRRACKLEIFIYRKVSGPRIRHCMSLSLDSRGDKVANFQTCQQWCEAIRCRSRGVALKFTGGQLVIPETHGRRFLIYCNPFSGTGKAESLLKEVVLPLLADGNCSHRVVTSLEAGYTRTHVKEVDLSDIDCIMIVSGDGLIYEIINGMMERRDREFVMKVPLAVVPSGSGNAVNASICYQTREDSHPANAAFICVKGQPVDLDVMEITGSSCRVYAILSVEWGLLADIDMASEAYRHLGSVRFTLGFFQQVFKHHYLSSRFSYLLANEDGSCPCRSSSMHCTCVPALDSGKPLPPSWNIATDDYLFIQPTLQTHITDARQFRHQSQLCDGRIHVVTATTQCSRMSVLQLFMEMANLKSPISEIEGVSDIPVLAFRIEPSPGARIDRVCHLAIDGEPYPFGPIQGRVHPALARIIAKLE